MDWLNERPDNMPGNPFSSSHTIHAEPPPIGVLQACNVVQPNGDTNDYQLVEIAAAMQMDSGNTVILIDNARLNNLYDTPDWRLWSGDDSRIDSDKSALGIDASLTIEQCMSVMRARVQNYIDLYGHEGGA